MSIQELVQNAKKEEGREETFEITLEINKLLMQGDSVESIAESLGVASERVQKMKNSLNLK